MGESGHSLRSLPQAAGTSLALDGTASGKLVEAVLLASRVLVAVATQSLTEVADRVTLPQYGTLVVLADLGPLSLRGLAERLDIHPSTATRQCDRLVAAGFVQRSEDRSDRRGVTLRLTRSGTRVVEQVSQRRREAIVAIVANMPSVERAGLTSALHTFADAAGEIPPEQAWSLSWDT